MAANTGQSSPDDAWLAMLVEEVLEPELIIDPHHHLWVRNGYTYLMPELASDGQQPWPPSMRNVIRCIGPAARRSSAPLVKRNSFEARRQ